MLLDVSSLFAKNISVADGTPEVLDMGEKGIGRVRGLNLFVEISEAVAGATSLTFKLYAGASEDGSDKEEIMVSPEYAVARLKQGFSFISELPAVTERYLFFEVVVDGVATAGKYWAGLTGSEQYAAHNRMQ